MRDFIESSEPNTTLRLCAVLEQWMEEDRGCDSEGTCSRGILTLLCQIRTPKHPGIVGYAPWFLTGEHTGKTVPAERLVYTKLITDCYVLNTAIQKLSNNASNKRRAAITTFISPDVIRPIRDPAPDTWMPFIMRLIGYPAGVVEIVPLEHLTMICTSQRTNE